MKKESSSSGGRYVDVSDHGPLMKILDKYRGEEGALIPILQDTQEAYGYLDEGIIRALSQGAGYQLSRVMGVATFYTQFRLSPIGEHLIKVCHGTACHVAGAGQITQEISSFLEIEDGGTTEDEKFTLESVMCLGACALAPIMVVDDNTHGKLKPTKVRKIIKGYAANGGEKK